MSNLQGSGSGPNTGGSGNYDWSINGAPGTSQPVDAWTEQPKQRSALVPVLVAVLCLLVVIVVVGALVLFLQRDKDDVLGEASVEQSSVMTSITASQGSSSSGESQDKESLDRSGKVLSRSGATDNFDPCMRLKESDNSLLAFSDEEAERLSDGYKNPVTLVVYCDGNWAQIAGWGSDVGYPLHWNGSEWESVEFHEPWEGGMWGGCWSREKLKSQGASEAALDTIMIPYCEDEKQANSGNNPPDTGANKASSDSVTGIRNPSCDGRYILIADSVVVQAGQDPQAAVNARLANYPGAYVAEPGACPSLRAVEPSTGGDIYAIYYDYGFDANAACAAAGTKGDHDYVRILTTNPGEYRSPC